MAYTINVQVRGKIASAINPPTYICGNSDYMIAFDLDDEWTAYDIKTARFSWEGKHEDVVFTGDECPVPVISNTYGFRVGVFAGDLRTTTAAYIPAKKSILCEEGMPADPEPDVYAQLMKRIDEIAGGGASEADIAAAIEKYMSENPVHVAEVDPSVHEWAKQPEKPKYTAEEVGAATKESIEKLSEEIVELKKAVNVEEYITAVGWGSLNKNSGYLNKSGNVTAHATYIVSDYIPAIPGTDIVYTDVLGVGQYPQIAVYDAEKTYLPLLSVMNPAVSGAGIRTSGTYTIPEGVAYFRIVDDSTLQGYYTYKQVQVDEDTNPWNGKVWHAFGTSITDTTHINEETGEPTGQYVPYLAEMSGLGVVNHGIAGGTLGKGGTHGGSANILSAILNADLSGADLITIEGFVNDYACAVDIGTVGDDGGTDSVEDTSTITLCGALYRAIKHCLENSSAQVVLITESMGREYTLKDGTSVNYTVAHKNSIDKMQNDYNKAIIDMGRFMGVRVIDAGGKSQIGQFCPEYLADHIHHNALGGKQYATVIWDELKNISPRVKTL